MMRASFFRLSPLLLLAAALVALAAFFVSHDARPAAADHSTVTVWSATLTTADISTSGIGCINAGGQPANTLCTTATVLTDDDFTYGGTDHSIHWLTVTSNVLIVQLALGNAFAAYIESNGTLHVGATEFAFTSATISSDKRAARWFNSGLSWSAGDTIQLKLTVPAPPSGVALAGSALDTSGGGFALAVNEGASATFTVALAADPGAATTIHLVRQEFGLHGGEPGDRCTRLRHKKKLPNTERYGTAGYDWERDAAAVSPASLSFTAGGSGNWGTPQTVTVSAAADADRVNEQMTILVLKEVGSHTYTVNIGTTDNPVNRSVTDPIYGPVVTGGSITGVYVKVTDTGSPTATTVTYPVDAPANFQARISSSLSGDNARTWWVNLSWDAPSGTVTGYEVQVSDLGINNNFECEHWTGATINDVSGTSLLYGYNYYRLNEQTRTFRFRVRATTSTGPGEWAVLTRRNVGRQGSPPGQGFSGEMIIDPETGLLVPANLPPRQDPPGNRAPTVDLAIADATIRNESGTVPVTLSGRFSDGDNDALTITAASSDEDVATVSVAADQSSLTVTAQSRGTATITVTAADGNGGTVSDSFTVTVKAAPVVASALGDLSLAPGGNHEVSLSGVFSDADGDALVITASSSDADAVPAYVWGSTLTVVAAAEGTATITVTAEDSDGNTVSDRFDVTVAAPRQQDPPANRAPTVASGIGDATIVSESGTQGVSLSGVFADADNDALTVTAGSSGTAVATVSVAADGSSLTVTAQARGTATITVTADDGNGGTVSDAFTVTVKAAPVVASGISDVSGLEEGAARDVSLAGVFSDADGDALTISAASSDDGVATVAVAGDGSALTLAGVAEGTATVTVTAEDSDGNRVSDAFDVSVVKAPEPDEPEPPTGAPTVVAPIDDFSLEGHEYRVIDLDGVFSDPDGDELSFRAVSSKYNVATMWVSGSTLTVVGTGTGTATITVTAEDDDGNTVSDEFDVSVSPAS